MQRVMDGTRDETVVRLHCTTTTVLPDVVDSTIELNETQMGVEYVCQ